METYALGYVQIASAFLSILLDSFTFMRLWKYSKEQRKLFHESSSRKKSYKREIYFLIQTVAADLIILVNLGIVFGIGAAENQTRIYYFIIQTELWVLVDTEKLIMSFICNLRIKRIYAEPSNNNARKINSVAPKSASGISRVN
ncbi:hypothetical protein FO519_009739 [Halicephalobus sp. NKZ332]|nr:hypothetical protein FO519_009739 [Halicephalobus sp. NKZ332]